MFPVQDTKLSTNFAYSGDASHEVTCHLACCSIHVAIAAQENSQVTCQVQSSNRSEVSLGAHELKVNSNVKL
eukprot:357572-Pelagomonas_calceolata.AAC.3